MENTAPANNNKEIDPILEGHSEAETTTARENQYEKIEQQPARYSAAAQQWLNAAPVFPELTDLFTLSEDNFPFKLLREMLDKPAFELTYEANYPASDWMTHFYFESKNREKVFGEKNLGIGYPLLAATQGEHALLAPLFFWQVQLEPHAMNPDQWSVQKHETQKLLPNYPLFHLLDQIHGSDFTAQVKKIGESGFIQAEALTEVANGIHLLLNLQETGLPLSMTPLPSANEIDQLRALKGGILWSAVVGIMPGIPKTTITHHPVVASNLPGDQIWAHPFSVLPIDPSQREVMLSAQRRALTVVEGASGTGKTHTIANLVANALSNGLKCLVVSKSIHALRHTQRFLLEKGMGDLTFVVRDIEGDHLMLADMLRMSADSKAKAAFNEKQYEAVLHRALRQQKRLDDAWEALHTPIFGSFDFAETVGLFLRANRAEGKELLNSQLFAPDFQFTKAEYDEIATCIKGIEPLFKKQTATNHPLSALHSDIFKAETPALGQKMAQDRLGKLLQDAIALHHRFIQKSDEYTSALTDHFEVHFNELSEISKKIRNQIEDGIARYGADFEKSAPVTEKLYGLVSDKFREIAAAKDSLAKNFEALKQVYNSRKYFDFDFPGQLDPRNVRKIGECNKDFEAALRIWRKRIPGSVREDVKRLTAKSVHFDLDFKEQIKDLEFSLDVFVSEFNEAALLEHPVKHEMLTLPKRQEFLEETIAQLEQMQFNMRDFTGFYEWQKSWIGLTETQQKVVRALSKLKPKNWAAAFDSWYLHHFLQQESKPGMAWNEEDLEIAESALRELRELMPVQINNLWQARKAKALRNLKDADPDAYKVWFGKNNRALSLTHQPETLFQKHISALSETLPVLLVTPHVALDVVNLSNMLFDLVLVDEAHNIPQQEAFHLFDMAKNLVVFGDSKQDMTPGEEDDFLEFCKKIESDSIALEYQHQDCPEEWVRFNKIAFHTPFRRIPSHKSAQDVTTVANVEGRYDELTKTNEAEARQVIDWLNLIEPTPNKTYPVVGIACATVQQRDLIASQLLKIRQRKAAGFEKIQQLHLNGLGVYQFSELQGHHVDVLMLSLTYGATDSQGSLTEDMAFWNTSKGMNQLHVALTRATKKVYLAHSLPPLNPGIQANRGSAILWKLTQFAQAVQEGNDAAKAQEMESLKQVTQYPAKYFPTNTFMEEVEIALQPYFEPGRIQRNATISGITAPLMIQNANDFGQYNIILIDGVFAKSAYPSFEWEGKLKRFFQKNAIEYVQTYSVQWWKNPKQEARKLASLIIRKDGDKNE